jgi:alpha,alpha-trehalase
MLVFVPRDRRLRRGAILAAALVAGCASSPGPVVVTTRSTPAEAARLYDPSRDLGPLFHDVQMARVFPDSKTFVDARPLIDPQEIAARYRVTRNGPDFSLKGFVAQYFEAPRAAGEGVHTDTTQTMEEHIRALWPALTRSADTVSGWSTLIPLPRAYVVPGGRFREVYYWDSYFTMIGLIESGRTDLMKNMLDNFAHLVGTVGHIPNANRTYYLYRSQPPFFSAMVGMYATATDTSQALPYLEAMEREYG